MGQALRPHAYNYFGVCERHRQQRLGGMLKYYYRPAA